MIPRTLSLVCLALAVSPLAACIDDPTVGRDDLAVLYQAHALAVDAVDCDSITLAWLPPEDANLYRNTADNLAGYHLRSRLHGQTDWNDIAAIDADATSYGVAGLASDTSYDFMLCVVDGDGVKCGQNDRSFPGGEAAPTVTGRTLTQRECDADPTPPRGGPEISNLRAPRSTTSSVTLTWDASNNVDFFRVFHRKSTSNATSWVDIDGDLRTYAVTGLSSGSTYRFQVCAYNDYGTPCTPWIDGSTQALVRQPPQVLAPTDFTVDSVGGHQVELSWTDNATNEDAYVVINTVLYGATVEFYFDANTESAFLTDLWSGTDHEVQVCAVKYGSGDEIRRCSPFRYYTTTGKPPHQCTWEWVTSEAVCGTVWVGSALVCAAQGVWCGLTGTCTGGCYIPDTCQVEVCE